MAHIRKTPRGKWQAISYLGVVAGRKKYQSRTFSRRRDAEVWAARQSVAVREGRLVAGDALTVADWLMRWLADGRATWAPKTIEQRELVIRLHLIPTLGKVRLDRLTAAAIQATYTRLADSTGTRTIGVAHAVLRAALGVAKRLGLVGVNVALDAVPPVNQPKQRASLDEGDLRRILDSAAEEGPLWSAFVYLLASSGLRRGEALGAEWGDLDVDAGVFNVRRCLVYIGGKPTISSPKTAHSRRAIALDAEALRRLQLLRVAQAEQRLRSGGAWRDTSIIFASEAGGYLCNVPRVWPRICRRAGLSLGLHQLRHAFASRALARGASVASVSRQLGHSSPATTLRVYAHATLDDQRDAVAAVSAALAQ